MTIKFPILFLRDRSLKQVLTGLCLLFFSNALFAGNLNLAWNPSTSSNVGGYKLFWGSTSNNYSASIDVGNVTTYQLSGLNDGATYFFALKAYDTAKTIESAFSNEISATIPPSSATLSVDFTANNTTGLAPLIASFTPMTTGTVNGYSWNFGSSSIPNSTAQNPTVTYSTPGTYTVSLTVTGSSGNVTKTKTGYISVSTPPPVANFSAAPTSGVGPLAVNFTDASTGSISSRSWDFGDGSTSTSTNPSHTYSATGVYTVSLTVTGAGGSNTKTVSNYINVSTSGGVGPTNNDGLVAGYGFEETSGLTVTDASGLGNHGTIKESVRTTNGRFGSALKFDGINDWVTVNDSASLDLTGGMTLEAWVYPLSQTNGGNTIIAKESFTDSVYSLYSEEDENLPEAYIYDGAYQSVLGTSRLPVNTWTHLVATYDKVYERLFVNGVEVAKKARNSLIKTTGSALRIGGNNLWGEYFYGYLDEIRIYNRALSATEINNNKTSPVSYLLGNTSLESTIQYIPKGEARAFRARAQKSGNLNKMLVYLDSSSTTTTELVAGAYKDNSGHPGALITQAKLSTLKLGAWNQITIPNASLTSGVTYWLAILPTNGQAGYRVKTTTGASVIEGTKTNSNLTALQTIWIGSSNKTQNNVDVSGFGMGN